MNTLKMTILKARKVFQKMMQENGFEKNKIEYFKSMVDKAVGNGWSLEIVDNKLEFEWTRGSFEQAPLSLASKAADIM